MSELRERMSNAMCLRGMAARTQEAYIGAVADLAMFYHRSPAELRVEEVHGKRPAGPPTNPVPVAAPSRGFHGRARWARLEKWQRTGKGM